MPPFKLISGFTPSRDQEKAIGQLTSGIQAGNKYQTLHGVTGSGKTYTMAKLIEQVQKPALVLTHNKTLAAQLYSEFKEFFPENAVEYFVSYYDYYQPEAYVASQDLYIEKDAQINDEIDRLRLKATSSVLSRNDVIIVSSVSCIYGLGQPGEYEKSLISIRRGEHSDRDKILRSLIKIYYERNDVSFIRGTFRVRGDIVEIFPAYLQDAFRIEFFGDEIEKITRFNPVSGAILETPEYIYIYPAKHFVSTHEHILKIIPEIERELQERLVEFKKQDKLLEAQRLETRVRYDIEMLQELGYTSGIENYSRIIDERKAGEKPACLLDYFRDSFITLVDESHVTLPQVRGMYHGDRSRKQSLVDHGFRLPSALDNRPLYFDEFIELNRHFIFVSATPQVYELELSEQIVEQIIRPTGLLDPAIEVRPAQNQVDDLIIEIQKRAERKERILVTTLTKKMAEDLSSYFTEIGIKARYLHSQIETLERIELLRDLRRGDFDCLVGINLLREGLDLPEVSLVAILDADKEGFLRSERSLIQTAGRAARNVNGIVIMYADKITKSMQAAIDETNRRRTIQEKYNTENNITPTTISKEVFSIIEREYRSDDTLVNYVEEYKKEYHSRDPKILKKLLELLRSDMLAAAEDLDFEKAAVLRDQMLEIEKKIKLYERIKN